MGFREDMRANNEQFKQSIKAGNEQIKKDFKEIGKPKSNAKDLSEKLRSIPTWQIVALLIFFFPAGLYMLWIQNRWTKRKKKTATWTMLSALVAFFALVIIFAPPTVTVTSSLSSIRGDSYKLTGKISPVGSLVTINGKPAKVSGDTFSYTVPLKEGDNDLRVVVVDGNKRTERTFKLHRYTKSEVVAQEKAAAEKKAALVAAQAKANAAAAQKKAAADAAAQTKQQQDAAAKTKGDADAAAKAAKEKSAAEAAAKAKADAAAAAAITVSQKNAVSKAKSYLNYTAFSHDGLVSQLEYEQFSHADAVYGADHSGGNWNEQAVKKAKDYMAYSSFSRGSLIDQLEYDKFTPDQAVYGVNAVGL